MPKKRKPRKQDAFLREPPGAVLVVFEDGSGIVRGDGSAEERRALRALLQDDDDDAAATAAAEGVAQMLLDRGMTIVPRVDPMLAADPRVMSGVTMEAIAALLSETN